MDIDAAMNAASEQLELSTDAGAATVPDTAAPDPTTVAAEPSPSTPATDTRSAEERARDDAGRFAKEKATKNAGKPGAVKASLHGAAPEAVAAQDKPAGAAANSPPTAPAGESVAPVVKAPQSWTPAAREAFAKAPVEVQKEVARRESEITRAMQETAHARQFATQVQQTLAPFEGLARANGMDSVKYAGSVMQTAAALHMGTPQQKAQVVAQLIGTYGIDVDAVNAVMQGQAPQQAQRAPPQQDVSQLVEQAFQQRLAQATEARASRAWEEFQGSAPEFLDSVKEDMREILMVAGQQGRNMTYQQAYDRACKLNEEVSAVLEQRKSAQSARVAQPVTQAARAAAGSARSRPAAAPTAQPRGIDGAMKAAAEKLGL